MIQKTLGIHILNTKEFHHFISGTDSVMFNIDRLRNILMARGLLRFTEATSTQYKIHTLEEAEAEGWTIVPHYVNKHIANQHTRPVQKELIELWD